MSGWCSVDLINSTFPFINMTGFTHFRLRFQKGDNNDNEADYMEFFSDNCATARPTLIIEYTLP